MSVRFKQLNSLYTGQTVILVVLVGAVVATLGLGTVARTVTNVQISSKIESAQVAMQAAEGAAAYGLSPYVTPGDPGGCRLLTTGTTASLNTSNVQASQCTANWITTDTYTPRSMGVVKKGESRTIWLVPHTSHDDPDFTVGSYHGSLEIEPWSSGALEIVDVEGSGKLVKYLFTTPQTVILDYAGRDIKAVRVKPLSSDTDITFKALAGVGQFPPQGKIVEATGVSTTGNDTRRIHVERWYPGLPAVFDYALFSFGDILKN